MTTKTLIGIIETRIASSEGNPTSKSFFYELHKALERLDAYESGGENYCNYYRTRYRRFLKRLEYVVKTTLTNCGLYGTICV